MTIRELIANNRVKEAFNLAENQGFDVTILQSSWNMNEKHRISGVITDSGYSAKRNQILLSFISLVRDTDSIPKQQIMQNSFSKADEMLSDVNQIIRDYKRKDKGILSEAIALRDLLRNYQDSKNENPSFDPSKRRLRVLLESWESLKQSVVSFNEDKVVSIVEKINDLLAETIPSWKNLSKAYGLCQGKGMSDHWIDTVLKSKPNDEDTKITVTERIENFLAQI